MRAMAGLQLVRSYDHIPTVPKCTLDGCGGRLLDLYDVNSHSI